MTKAEFEAALAALVAARPEGEAYESVSCVRSPGTMFSEDCEDCYRCLYCERLRACVACTHSSDCERCSSSSHCRHCRDCSGCNYVTWSVGCHECNYCFGCVGLVRKDFHILNVAYDRAEYFERVAALGRALGLKGS